MKPILLCCLIVPAVLPAATLNWDSSSPGTSICTAGNWVENTVPADGDIFIFPSGLTGNDLLVTGDVDCGSGVFQQQEWRFLGGGYTVGGEIQLQAGALSTVGSTVDSFRHDTSSNTINATVTLTGASEGVFGFESNGGTITYNGAVEGGKHTLVVAGAGNHRFNARTGEADVLGTDKARLVKRGTGRAHFTAAANFGRGAAVNAGELFLEGSAAVLRSQESVTVAAAAELTSELGVIRVTGAGTGRTISLAGTTTTSVPDNDGEAGLTLESTGASGSAVTKSIGGNLTVTSALFLSYSNFTDRPVLRVSGYGAVSITSGALLTMTPGGGEFPGQFLTVIDNRATDSAGAPLPISGTFSGKPQGFVETVAGIRYGYDYSGGDGNDLVITILPPLPTGTSRIWNGANGDTLWSTAGNWAGPGIPARGDVVLFGTAAATGARTVALADSFPVVSGMTISASGYVFSDARPLFLNGVLSHTVSGTTATQMATALNFSDSSTISVTGSASLTMTGDLDLPRAGQTLTVHCQNTGTPVITLEGSIQGQGNFTKTGTDLVVMSGTQRNAIGGLTRVEAGELRLQRTGEPCLHKDALVTGSNARLTIATADQVNSNLVTLSDRGKLAVNASDFISTVALDDGTIEVGAGAQLSADEITATALGGTIIGTIGKNTGGVEIAVAANGVVSHLSGSIKFASDVTKKGPGTLVLGVSPSGSSDQLNISEGTVEISGTTTWAVGGLGRLAGSGQVKQISPLTVLDPAVAPGTVAAPAARLTAGKMNLGGNIYIDIRGNTAGTSFDQLRALASAGGDGSVSVSGARLNIVMDGGYLPPPGTSFLIVDNDGTDAVSGAFNDPHGFPFPGNIVSTRYAQFRISYAGGTGNDIVLTAIAPTAIDALRTWDGGSAAGNQWSDAANWAVDRTPLLGESVTFPDTAARLSPVHDLAGGFVDEVRINGGGTQAMTFTGTTLGLLGDFRSARIAGDVLWQTPLRLLGTGQNLSRTTGTGFFRLDAPVDLNGKSLDLSAGTGSVLTLMQGTTGAGTVTVDTSGTVRMQGSAEYQGTALQLQRGTLELASVLDFTTVDITGILRVESTGVISQLGTVTVEAGGVLEHSSTVVTPLAPLTLRGGSVTGSTTPLLSGLTLGESTSSSIHALRMDSSGSFFTATLNSTQTTPMVVSSGGVELSGQFNPALSATSLNFALNQVITLISKTSAGPVTGTFSGLAQSATFTVSGQTFRISYTGGDGNDVTLTKVSGFTAVTPKLLTATVTFSGGTPQNPENARFQATWQASGGQNGMLQHSTGLDAWTTVALVTASGAGIFTVDQTLPYAPRRFFRIVP